MNDMLNSVVSWFASSGVVEGIGVFAGNVVLFFILKIAVIVIGGMLGLGFLIMTSMDLFLIQIPSLGNLINLVTPASNINAGAFLQNTFYYTTIFVVIFSIILWLLLGGFNYLKLAISNINNSGGTEEDKKASLIKLTFKMLISLSLIALIPIILKVLFYIMYLLSILLFKMGIAPLGITNANEIDTLYRYPMTTVYMIVADIDGSDRKVILDKFEEDRSNGKTLSTISTGLNSFLFKAMGNVDSIFHEAQTGVDGGVFSAEGSSYGGFIAGIAKLMLYIMFIFMYLSIITKLFVKLITRFVGIIIHSVFLPLNVAMLGTVYAEKVGLRSIVSYFGSLLITPIIYAVIGFGITILLTFKANVIVNLVGVDNVDLYLYGTILLLLGYGLLTFLYQVINNFGTELENIILGYSGASGYDATQDVQQGLGAAKTFLGVSAVGSQLQGVAQKGIQSGLGKAGHGVSATGKFTTGGTTQMIGKGLTKAGGGEGTVSNIGKSMEGLGSSLIGSSKNSLNKMMGKSDDNIGGK